MCHAGFVGEVGEEIVIGKQVVVGVARVTRNRVYLTIEAPADVRVDRQEIRVAKNQERPAVSLCEPVGLQRGPGVTRQG